MAVPHDKCCRCPHCNRRRNKAHPGACKTCFARPAVRNKQCAPCNAAAVAAGLEAAEKRKQANALLRLSDREARWVSPNLAYATRFTRVGG